MLFLNITKPLVVINGLQKSGRRVIILRFPFPFYNWQIVFPPSIAEFSHCALGPRKVGGKQRKGEQDKVTTEQEQQQQLVAGAADAVGVEEQSELGKRNWEREAGNGK